MIISFVIDPILYFPPVHINDLIWSVNSRQITLCMGHYLTRLPQPEVCSGEPAAKLRWTHSDPAGVPFIPVRPQGMTRCLPSLYLLVLTAPDHRSRLWHLQRLKVRMSSRALVDAEMDLMGWGTRKYSRRTRHHTQTHTNVKHRKYSHELLLPYIA